MRGRAPLVFSVIVGGFGAAFVAPSAAFIATPARPSGPGKSRGPIAMASAFRPAWLSRAQDSRSKDFSRDVPTDLAVIAGITAPPAATTPVPPTPPEPAAPVVAAPAAAPVARRATGAVRAPASAPRGVWGCIRARESGGNYATNTGNGYYGAYQFSLATWRGIGGTGYPNQASSSVQDAMAHRLQQQAGWSQWSTHSGCGV